MRNPQSTRRILFAGASARWACQTAQLAGIESISADLFNDLDTRNSSKFSFQLNNYRELMGLVDEIEADGFVILGGMENQPDLVSRMECQLPHLGSPVSSLRNSKQVNFLNSVFGDLFPKTKKDLSDVDFDQQWIQKKIGSAGGFGINEVKSDQPVAPKANRVFQLKITGNTFGAVFLANGKKTVLVGVTRQLSGAPFHDSPYVYVGSVGPIDLTNQMRTQIESLGARLVDATPVRGLFGIDIIQSQTEPDQFFVVDVNLRITASCEILQKAIGNDSNLIQLHLDAVQGRFPENPRYPTFRSDAVFGKAIVFNETQPLLVSRDMLAQLQQPGLELEIADVPAVGTLICPFHPIVTVFCKQNDLGSATRALKRKREQILNLFAS